MQQRVLVIGGTGRIGCPTPHKRASASRSGRSEERGRAAAAEVARDSGGAAPEFRCCDWTSASSLAAAVRGFDAVVHTAGPFSNSPPVVLEAAIAASVPAYVDLSDPVEYIDQALAMGPSCTETVALTAAGAFPGLSNILAMECASRLPADARVKDLEFQYFTAGLGGSGEVNLLITNEGFGEPVPVYQNGRYAPQMNAGGDERTVEFFLDSTDRSAELVGERAAWAWPFPEARTVARQLDIAGDSWVGMGTAPAIWNDLLGLFVKIVPRAWWRGRVRRPREILSAARRGDRSLRRRDARDARRRDVDRRRGCRRAGARVVPTRRRRAVRSLRWRCSTRGALRRVHARRSSPTPRRKPLLEAARARGHAQLGF